MNLLADEEIFPEFLTYRDCSAAMADQLLAWLNDPVAYAATKAKLDALKSRVAVPGASERAAEFVLDRIGVNSALRAAA